MGIVSESPVIGLLGTLDNVLSMIGMTNPLYDKAMEADFEPDPLQRRAQTISQGATSFGASVSEFSGARIGEEDWSGGGREGADENKDCMVSFEESLLDMYTIYAEIIVQILDYLVDIIRVLIAVIGAALAVITALITVGLALAFITGGASIAQAAVAVGGVLTGTFWAMVGLIGAVLTLAALLMAGLNALLEWLQDSLAEARSGGCLKGETPLPDWDPKPPGLPV